MFAAPQALRSPQPSLAAGDRGDSALTTRAGLPAAATGPLSCGTQGRPQHPASPTPAGPGAPLPPSPAAPPRPPPLQQRPSCASAASPHHLPPCTASPPLPPARPFLPAGRDLEKKPSHGLERRQGLGWCCRVGVLSPAAGTVPVRGGACSPLPSLAFRVGFLLFHLIFSSPVIMAGAARLRGRGRGSSCAKCSLRSSLRARGLPKSLARHFLSFSVQSGGGGARLFSEHYGSSLPHCDCLMPSNLRAWELMYLLTQRGKITNECFYHLGGCAGQRPCCFAHETHGKVQSWACSCGGSPTAFLAAGHI